jgi:hypothetical protein
MWLRCVFLDAYLMLIVDTMYLTREQNMIMLTFLKED